MAFLIGKYLNRYNLGYASIQKVFPRSACRAVKKT